MIVIVTKSHICKKQERKKKKGVRFKNYKKNYELNEKIKQQKNKEKTV